MRCIGILCLALVLPGCSLSLKPEVERLRPDDIRVIEMNLASEDLGVPLSDERATALREQIGKNLAGWGYPIKNDDHQTPTHALTARVGNIEKKSTPPGFSFSVGNSDPRALDFQRAEVRPVICELRSVNRSSETAKLSMAFTADRNTPMDFKTLSNHLGTACYNLLSELKVARLDTQTAAASEPSWIPEVRIEVREKPAVPPPGKPVPQASASSSGGPSTEPAAAPVSSSSAQPNTVKTETRASQGDGRKQLIIHNQGSPIILEFGYERK